MLSDEITVCVPHIASRHVYLHRALNSIHQQTHAPKSIAIAYDVGHDGAAVTRQRSLDMVTTDWVAFLDDDDEFRPWHLEHLLEHARATDADYVYSWFDVAGGGDPFPPSHFLNEFNPDDPVQTTITVLVKRELAQEVGFGEKRDGVLIKGQTWGEDYQFTLGCLKAGGVIKHLVERTWIWHHDSQNTSGRGDRW